jgi:toxin YoeB
MSARFEILLDPGFIEDLQYWIDTDRRVASRLLTLVRAVIDDPFSGLGKPEPLRYQLRGAWSRRLTHEHRLVYVVDRGRIILIQARYHYDK